MTETRRKVAWATGRHINCLSCSDKQVSEPEPVYVGDPRLWDGMRCAWCRKKFRTN